MASALPALQQNLASVLAAARDQDLSALPDDVRNSLIETSQAITCSLQKPSERIFGTIASALARNTAIRICADLNVFLLLSSKSSCTVSDIASQTGAQELLVTRLMRMLAAGGFVHEIAVNTFAANDLTTTLADPQVVASLYHWFDRGMPSCARMPEYFKERAYKLPTDEVSGPHQYAMGTNLETYAYWRTMPGWMENFSKYMSGVVLNEKGRWTDFYPIAEKLLDGFDERYGDGYLYVDVGGGLGHDTKLFKDKTQGRSIGKLALEDLPAVLDDTAKDLDPSIERVAQDFFQEQKIKGARSYLLSHILHNWPEPLALRILSRIHDAMSAAPAGYSKLLIAERIFPDKGATEWDATMDMSMMIFHAGMERNEGQWQQLLGKAGFRVEQFWIPEEEGQGIIEAVVNDVG